MSYRVLRKAKSIGGSIAPRETHRMSALPPKPEQAAADAARAVKRWLRYQRRMERLDQDDKPPRHIQAKARLALNPRSRKAA